MMGERESKPDARRARLADKYGNHFLEKEVDAMTKSEMVKRLAETWGGLSNRQANDQLDQLVEFITKTVKKDKELKIPNLCTFRLRQLKARTGRNPQTG